MFKGSNECWKNALKQAQIKEEEYISRCRSYLDMNRLVLEESKNAAQQGIKKECKVTPDDFRKYEKITDTLRKSAFLDKMDRKLRDKRNASNSSTQDRKSIDLNSDEVSPDTSPIRPEKSYMSQTLNQTVQSPPGKMLGANLGNKTSSLTADANEPSLSQVKEKLKEKVTEYLRTLESPIAGGKAISISMRPDSLEQKEIRSRQVIEVV